MSKRTQNATAARMTCFQCGQDTLLLSGISVDGERHGEIYPVLVTGYKCSNCGFQTIDSRQGEQLTRLVSDAYRGAHGLLTGGEIKLRRARLGKNQQEFADYLGIGSASVKRWEIGQIQDRAMDELIRLKTDPDAARQNLRTLERQIPEPFVISEERDFVLTIAAGSTQYYEPPPMHVQALVIAGGDREGNVRLADVGDTQGIVGSDCIAA
jgi:putative zinc finger/helix-turn-helix YgiT family protein